jgi:hypothetical protein
MLGAERSSSKIVAQVVLALFKLGKLEVSDNDVERVSYLMRKSIDEINFLVELCLDSGQHGLDN